MSIEEKNEGYHMTCDAFPDGIPFWFDYGKVEVMDECNNGIKYKEISKK